MERRVLVKGHGVRGVGVAVDVTTTPTVMATLEVGEGAFAGGIVTHRGGRIWLGDR